MVSGLLNLYNLDTTPGANCVFAPPQGWVGDDRAYKDLIRQRYSRHMQIKQYVNLIARRMRSATIKAEITFAGPFEHLAKEIINGVVIKQRQIAAMEAAEEAKKSQR